MPPPQTRKKTITEIFREGKLLDAAVKRAIRTATAPGASGSKARRPKRKRAA